MDSAVQAQGELGPMSRLHPEQRKSSKPPRACERIVARLISTGDYTARVQPYPFDTDACIPEIEDPFLIGHDLLQRNDGLTGAVIGEPCVADDQTKGTIRRIDASVLLELYEKHRNDCLKMLQGRWAVVIIDPGRARIVLACDRMGRQSLYYRISDDEVLIGDSLSILRECSGQAGLDAQSLYHYLYFHMVPAPSAVTEGFRKLSSAQVLVLSPESQSLTRYWTPAFDEIAPSPVATAHIELRGYLRNAVKRCTQVDNQTPDGAIECETDKNDRKVGAFLSGGLDSSTVAGMLSEVQGGSADAYAIGFDAEGYDEMPYARIVARHFGIRLHEHYVTPDEVVEALPKIAVASDEPFGNSSVLPAYFCALMARDDGVDVLLAGDGGDELFAGNERYANQRIFEVYRRIPHSLRSGLIEPLVKNIPDFFPLAYKGRSFLRQANTPLPERLQYYSFLEQNSPDDVFTAQFLRRVERTRPLELLNGIYHYPNEASVLNRMLFMDWQITLADNDLRKVNRACALAGVTVRYPMLDDDLVEYSTRIPSTWKLPSNSFKGSRLRHFYKQALIGWLPEETINKSKHGFGLPFGVWMRTHKPLQELAYDNILRLKERGIFLPGFLDQAIASHRDGHAAYYGELIWILTCMELWLASNEPIYHCE